MSCSAQKFLAAGHIGSFQIHPKTYKKPGTPGFFRLENRYEKDAGRQSAEADRDFCHDGRPYRVAALPRLKLRVVRFQELFIVRGQNVNAGGMDGDTLVVDKGQIVQRGTHEALMAQGGIYRRFITGREQAVGWKL